MKMEEYLYPLKFYPIYKDRIWGGTSLKILFNRELPGDKIGESWDIACHENGTSIIKNGDLKDMPLNKAIEKYKRKILGTILSDADIKKFPLLIKLLDANDILSVQVHPDDEYAKIHENGELGKCEMWYVISAKPGATIVYGLKENITKEKFIEAVNSGKVEETLNVVPVKKGDVFNVPAGMLHALGAGVVVAEIQQNSDTVYRVYDWNRVGFDGKPRELHVKKALDVIDFMGRHPNKPIEGLKAGNKTYVVANKYFAVEIIDVKDKFDEIITEDKFVIYTCVDGKGRLTAKYLSDCVECGESILVPANTGKISFEGNMRLLKSYVPDINKDIVLPLENAGYTINQYKKIIF